MFVRFSPHSPLRVEVALSAPCWRSLSAIHSTVIPVGLNGDKFTNFNNTEVHITLFKPTRKLSHSKSHYLWSLNSPNNTH